MNPYQLTAFAVLAFLTAAAILFTAGAATVRFMDWLDRRRVRYRELKRGETIRQGDEWNLNGVWVESIRVGQSIEGGIRYRRPLNQEGNK